MDINEAKNKIDLIKNNISKVIVGKEDLIDKILVCLIADGHVLLEDLPGTGKTMIAKTLSVSIDSKFSRIQFTPDLLPADIVGLNIYDKAKESFKYVKGPIVTNILLADEINRATPRTQSALLEAMQERQFTVDGETRKLEDVFFVIATQNPVETTGTFPLPEAELDRFMMRLSVGELSLDEEVTMLKRFENNEPLKEVESVVSLDVIVALRNLLNDIFIHPDLIEYIAKLSEATRKDSSVYMGVSPRGSLALLKASKAMALINGRDYVLPDDIKALAPSVFLHRMLFINRKDVNSGRNHLKTIVNAVPVPSEKFDVR